MEVKMEVIEKGNKWNILVNGEVVTECIKSYKFGGSYQFTLDNATYNVFTQKRLKERVIEHFEKRGVI